MRRINETMVDLNSSVISAKDYNDNSRTGILPSEEKSNSYHTKTTIKPSNTIMIKKKFKEEESNLKNFLNNLGKQIIEDEKDFMGEEKKTENKKETMSKNEMMSSINSLGSAKNEGGKIKKNLYETTIKNKFNQFLLMEKFGVKGLNQNLMESPEVSQSKRYPHSLKKELETIQVDGGVRRDSKQRRYSTELNLPNVNGGNDIFLFGNKKSTSNKRGETPSPLFLLPKKTLNIPSSLDISYSGNTINPPESIINQSSHSHRQSVQIENTINSIKPGDLTKESLLSSLSKNKFNTVLDNEFTPIIKSEGEDDRTSIKQFNNVYDSLDDGEDGDNLDILFDDYTEEDPWVFKKNSKFLRNWSGLMFILILYSVTFSPYFIAFNDIDSSFIKYLDLLIDVTFLIDIVINFFSPYRDFEGELVANHKMIIVHYFTSWFWLDAVSSFPTGIFSLIMEDSVDVSRTNSKVESLKNFIRLSRLYRLTKWLKIVRLIKLAKKQDQMSPISSLQFIHSLEMNRFVVFTCIFIILMHVANCLWIFIAKVNEEAGMNWIHHNKFNTYNNFSMYMTGIYFIICTVFSIGYGDITSTNNVERVYNIVFMLFGVVLFSFCLSALSSLFSKLDAKALNLQDKFRILEEIRKDYKIPKSLLDKIKKTITHEVKKTNIERYEFIDSLPHLIKNEIFLVMHKNHIKQLNFFKLQPHDFILYVLPLFKPLPISKGETLFSIGEFVEEMYLVAKGNLSLNLGSVYDYIEIAQIREGNHIGDVILYLHEQSPYDLKCRTDTSEVFVIKRSDFFKIKMHFNLNILFILQNSMKAMELFEKRRFIVQHFRKFEIDPKKIFQKMKTLNLMLMNKDFDEYYYNEGELQDMNDFIETVDSEELMKILGIDQEKVEKIKRMKTEMDLMNFEKFDESEEVGSRVTWSRRSKRDEMKSQKTLKTHKTMTLANESRNEESDRFNSVSDGSSGKENKQVRHVKFKLESHNSMNTIHNIIRAEENKHSRKTVNSLIEGSDFPNKHEESSSVLLLNNHSNSHNRPSKVQNSSNSRSKNSTVRVRKEKVQKTKEKVRKIVNEILLVNHWRRNFGNFGNNDTLIEQENNAETLQINPQLAAVKPEIISNNSNNPPGLKKKSAVGELNFDIIKNELIYNEKAGNVIGNVGDSVQIQKIKSEIAELGKKRRKSLCVMNAGITNNLVDISREKDKYKTNKLTSAKFLKPVDLNSPENKVKIKSSYELNNYINDSITPSYKNPIITQGSNKNSNKISNSNTPKSFKENPSININFYQYETNYNQNYIFMDEEKKKKESLNTGENKSPSHSEVKQSSSVSMNDLNGGKEVTSCEDLISKIHSSANFNKENMNISKNIGKDNPEFLIDISQNDPLNFDHLRRSSHPNQKQENKDISNIFTGDTTNNDISDISLHSIKMKNKTITPVQVPENSSKRNSLGLSISPTRKTPPKTEIMPRNSMNQRFQELVSFDLSVHNNTISSSIKNQLELRAREKNLVKNYKKIDRLYYLIQKMSVNTKK